jgi:hypothetical protein
MGEKNDEETTQTVEGANANLKTTRTFVAGCLSRVWSNTRSPQREMTTKSRLDLDRIDQLPRLDSSGHSFFHRETVEQ